MNVIDKLTKVVTAALGAAYGAITVMTGDADAETVRDEGAAALFAKRRTAVQYAQDKQKALKKEQAALKKDQAKLDKKVKKQRAKQAEKIYKARLAKGYDNTLAAVDNAALQNAADRRDAARKAMAAGKDAIAKATAYADAAEAARIKAAKN